MSKRFPRIANAMAQASGDFEAKRIATAQRRASEAMNEMAKAAEAVIIDLVNVECTSCSRVREWKHDPPLRGGEGLRDFMHSIAPCACGETKADVKCRLVEELADKVN